MDARRAWEAKYASEPAPWRPGRPPPLDLLKLPSGARVLEVGAGGGRTFAEATARGFRVVGCDLARTALPPGSVQADAAALPFGAGAFDGVLLVHVLGHLEDAARTRAAREAWRVLRAGGALLAVVLGTGDVRAAGLSPGAPRLRGGIATRHFTEGEVAALLPECEVATRRVPRRWGTREVVVAWRAAGEAISDVRY